MIVTTLEPLSKLSEVEIRFRLSYALLGPGLAWSSKGL